MKGEIMEAAERLSERVQAANLDTGMASESAAEEALRRAYSGLDLDFGELRRFAERRQKLAFATCLLGVSPGMVAMTYFVEGIVTGLLIAEAREKAGQSE